MRFATSFITVTVAATLALAAPQTYPPQIYESPTLANLTAAPRNNDTTTLIDKRASEASATYCEHSMHTQPCAEFKFAVGQCYNLPPYWNDKVSSVFPTSKTDRCIVWSDASCAGKSLTVTWPGINKLADRDMDDQVSSIKCFKIWQN
ncbi:hypothetical protein SLS54_002251 [Diplodia seriata]